MVKHGISQECGGTMISKKADRKTVAEMSPNVSHQPISKRTRLSFAQKLEILDLLNKGALVSEIQRRFACSKRTVLNIKSKRTEIIKTVQTTPQNLQLKAQRPARFQDVEAQLFEFVEAARASKLPLSLLHFALKLYLSAMHR